MKTELSEYYGNGNGRTAKVLIETMGTEKRFYVDCYTKDMWNGTVEKSTEQAAEDFAEDFVLYNLSLDGHKSILSE
tara:strand:+ start:68 stop:295 length:228 start_codon:yes stop_codon:yes gene_type:complete